MFLALKEIKKEKGRFLLIISIVVLISYLVFFLIGLAYGLAKDNTTAVEKWEAETVVLKSGTNSNILSSMMGVEVLDDFKDYETSPVNIARSVGYIDGVETERNTVDLVLIGLHQDSKAYPDVIEGELPENRSEVLGSITLKEENEIDIGDTIVLSMNDREFTITGFTEESKFNVSPVIYTDLNMASAAMMVTPELDNESSQDQPEEGAENPEDSTKENELDPEEQPIDGGEEEVPDSSNSSEVPERISGILLHENTNLSSDDDYDVLPINDFIFKLPGYLAQVLTFGLMIGFLILISTIVLGVFMYIITTQKKQTFGIMKVQGISNGYIAKSVVLQTFLVSLIGVSIGLGLTFLSEYFLPYTVPFRSNIYIYLIVSVLIILISLIGAIFSVKSVSKVDPLEVLD